ncbi:septum formation family protein [Williamsia sp. CHRR-6]|uniref:septum formation family protein n=1 Tax=Williamsia sp. CHRR-6 TaxID=2835871 RepID=UPI001BDAF204|nr:septum formation family protein [Williamsia sp. CHRR-6]MBT0567619.1 septum formation family protein [Williamsia sp. CHRR-6]
MSSPTTPPEPDPTAPDQTEPDQTQPDQTQPDQTGRDQTQPDQTGPDQTQPAPTGPDAGAAVGRPDRWHRVRAHPLRTVLGAVVIGALICGGIVVASGGFSDSGQVSKTAIGADDRGPAKNDFNQSVPGDCLTWPPDDPGKPSKIGCGGQHYFEVAHDLDPRLLPPVEFDAKAAWPTRERFIAIKDQFCPAPVTAYLGGRYDPKGRFSIGLLYPSRIQWDAGERAMRCGLQLSDARGRLQPFLGRVADLDQALQWPVGTCVGIDLTTRQPTDTVACAEQHAFQVTGLVRLGVKFGAPASGRPWPPERDQNAFLATTCPTITNSYFGGQPNFAKTTLNVQWSTISQAGWAAGSRTVVCFVALPDGPGFATLTGDAKGDLLINGRKPVPPPAEPPGRLLPTPVPLAPGLQPNPTEVPAPEG